MPRFQKYGTLRRPWPALLRPRWQRRRRSNLQPPDSSRSRLCNLCSTVGPSRSASRCWVVVIAGTVLYAIAFVGVYSRQHTAVSASEWINANAPLGSRIINGGSFGMSACPIWGGTTFGPLRHTTRTGRTKMRELVERLSSSDYVVFYSNRAYGAVTRLPDRYPQSAAFYRQLFAGELGYRLERAFVSYPSLAGVSFRDDPYDRAGLQPPPLTSPDADDGRPSGLVVNLGYADENVVGYDHPQALLFRNVERLPAEVLSELILTGEQSDATVAPLMFGREQLARQREGGTWSEVFDRNGWPARVPGLAWLAGGRTDLPSRLPVDVVVDAASARPGHPVRPRRRTVAGGLGSLDADGLRLAAIFIGTVWLALASSAVPSSTVLWMQWRAMLRWLRDRWKLVATAEGPVLAGVRRISADPGGQPRPVASLAGG